MPDQTDEPQKADCHPRIVLPPPWRADGDFGVCPDCAHVGEYYNGLSYVCEDSGLVVDDDEKCSAPGCNCTATRPQCPECGAGMWYATTKAEYETGWPEPMASEIWQTQWRQPDSANHNLPKPMRAKPTSKAPNPSAGLPRMDCSASWFAKLEAGYNEAKPVRLTAGEAASAYRALRNEGVTAEFAANRAAGIGCDTSWQND